MEALALVLALVALALAVTALAFIVRAERRPAEHSISGARTADLERRVRQLSQRLEAMEADSDAQRRGGEISAATSSHARGSAAISHMGLVRFDAFEDAGGAQSFALAMVDDDGDGIVLTSLHSRPTTRVYVKAIRRGVADAPLSVEEMRALQDAGITPTT